GGCLLFALALSLLLQLHFALALHERLTALFGCHRCPLSQRLVRPPPPRRRARRGGAASPRATVSARRPAPVASTANSTSFCAQRPSGRLPPANAGPSTERRSPSSVWMKPRSFFSLNQSILPRIGIPFRAWVSGARRRRRAPTAQLRAQLNDV